MFVDICRNWILMCLIDLDINFSEIYDELSEKEQLDFYEYIEFLKTKPSKEQFIEYNVPEHFLIYLVDFLKTFIVQNELELKL